jgi:hypothetical protein
VVLVTLSTLNTLNTLVRSLEFLYVVFKFNKLVSVFNLNSARGGRDD